MDLIKIVSNLDGLFSFFQKKSKFNNNSDQGFLASGQKGPWKAQHFQFNVVTAIIWVQQGEPLDDSDNMKFKIENIEIQNC